MGARVSSPNAVAVDEVHTQEVEAQWLWDRFHVLIGNSHSTDRHGPSVSNEQLQSRIIDDDISCASRFLSSEIQSRCRESILEAYETEMNSPVAIDRGRFLATMDFSEPIGVGLECSNPADPNELWHYDEHISSATFVFKYVDWDNDDKFVGAWSEITGYPDMKR